MALTLNQAAKACGRSKSTLLDAIRSGRMSAPKDDRGRYAIDPAELHRDQVVEAAHADRGVGRPAASVPCRRAPRAR